MSVPSVQFDDQQVTSVVQSALEPEIKSFEQQLKDSIRTGLEQVERGEYAPFDDAYKAEIRALAGC